MQSQPTINENSKKIINDSFTAHGKSNLDMEDVHNRLYKAVPNKMKTHKVNKEIEHEVTVKLNPLIKLDK